MTPPPTLQPTTTEVILSTITTEPSGTTEESPNCSIYTNKPVACKMHGGEYRVPDGTCICGPIEICTNESSLTSCRRGNGLYSVGGVTCISPYSKRYGNCNMTGDGFDVVIAVNLNGPQHIDSRNIKHVAERSDQYTDNDNNRHPLLVQNWKHSQCKTGISSTHPTDTTLFNSLIIGRNEARRKGKCISYHSQITKNGRYEFNVRTAETYWSDKIGNGAKPRYFNIYLNDVLIWVEFNILHYAAACHGVHLFAEFVVTDGILTHAGSRPSRLGNYGHFEVQFCYGGGFPVNAVYDPNYIISLFYIIKLPPANKPMPTLPPTLPTLTPILSTTTRRAITTTKSKRTTTTVRTTATPKSILSTTIKPVTPGPTPTSKPLSCAGVNPGWDENFCGCIDRLGNCDVYFQAVATTGKLVCRPRIQDCIDLALQHQRHLFPGNACRRARGTYSYGGLICNNAKDDGGFPLTIDTGDCKINKTIVAVRFNGNRPYRDTRNITYQPMTKVPPKDAGDYDLIPIQLSKGLNGNTFCHGNGYPQKTYQGKDHELWESFATGSNTSVGHCFNYTFPTPYELNIKTTEYEYADVGSRTFNVYLNGSRLVADGTIAVVAIPAGAIYRFL